MSEATLKKKTLSKYNNNSVSQGHQGFSLNGTHRSQGWVGQDLRARTLVRTLNRRGANRGHGGCCGTYPRPFVIPSEIRTTENPNVIKSPVLNTNGMLRERFAWIWRPEPYTSVKLDDNHGLGDQGSYIEYLKQWNQHVYRQACPTEEVCGKPTLGAITSDEYNLEYKSDCVTIDSLNNFCVSRGTCVQCPRTSS